MSFFVPNRTFLYPDDLDVRNSSATLMMTFTFCLFIQIYIFLASNLFPMFVLTGNTIFEGKKIQMNLKAILKYFYEILLSDLYRFF